MIISPYRIVKSGADRIFVDYESPTRQGTATLTRNSIAPSLPLRVFLAYANIYRRNDYPVFIFDATLAADSSILSVNQFTLVEPNIFEKRACFISYDSVKGGNKADPFAPAELCRITSIRNNMVFFGTDQGPDTKAERKLPYDEFISVYHEQLRPKLV